MASAQMGMEFLKASYFHSTGTRCLEDFKIGSTFRQMRIEMTIYSNPTQLHTLIVSIGIRDLMTIQT